MRSFSRVILIAILFLAPMSASATVIYAVDDGSAETLLGQSGFGDFLWGNYFTEVVGGTLVTDIELVFGSVNVPVNRVFTALLYDDSDDDGDPTTGTLTLLASTSATVQNPQGLGPNTFESVDIVDSVVSGGFFVAAYMDGTGNPFPANFDQTSNSGQSWFAEHSASGGLDVNDPFGTAAFSGEPETFGFPGNFMVRARATGIPAPTTLILTGLGLFGIGYTRQKKITQRKPQPA